MDNDCNVIMDLSLSLSPHLSGKSEFFDGELGMLGDPFLTVPFLTLSYRATCTIKIDVQHGKQKIVTCDCCNNLCMMYDYIINLSLHSKSTVGLYITYSFYLFF